MDPKDLKYDRAGLIPVVVQQYDTGEVLMVAYMNEEAVRKTVQTGLTWFWSRSRQKYWQKGETSGHVQRVKEILYDCDLDTLLVKVDQVGVACHTGERTCFYRRLDEGDATQECDAVSADQQSGMAPSDERGGQ